MPIFCCRRPLTVRSTPGRQANRAGQSLVEFALTLPAALLLILLSVRVLMLLSAWYVLVNAADVGARAAAITGSADAVRRVVLANFPGVDPADLIITISPDQATFDHSPTATASPRPTVKVGKGTPAAKPPPTLTPDPLAAIDPRNIADYPIRVSITYNIQLVGPMVATWRIRLTASATARLETQLHPLPTLPYF